MDKLGTPTQNQQAMNDGKTDVEDDAKVAIYARTSSTSQRFGYSIDEQVRRCWEQCQQAGWDVRYVFTDEAVSGKNTDRPKLQAMLNRAQQGHIDIVIFWKLDRFCRSLADLVRTEEQLNQWGVALQSITEQIDTTTPVGRFNFRNLASAAEFESDLTSQRAKMGLYGLAQEHKWPNDHPPLGYEKATDGTLRVKDKEAELVERIFRLYLDELSMPQVAFLLNDDGVQTKRNEEWRRQTVSKVLSNELYTGMYQVADYEEHVESYRIVDDELFENVTEARYRFRHARNEMDDARKHTKSDRILGAFRKSIEEGSDEWF